MEEPWREDAAAEIGQAEVWVWVHGYWWARTRESES